MRKRRYADRGVGEELKAQIIAEAMEPGASIREVATRHGYHRGTVDKWLQRERCLREAAIPTANSYAYLTRSLPEPERSALLAKIERDQGRMLEMLSRLTPLRG